jgi:hypothetical protein
LPSPFFFCTMDVVVAHSRFCRFQGVLFIKAKAGNN